MPCLQHSSTALNSGDPIGKYSNLTVSLFAARNFLVVLEQLGVALSTKITILPNYVLLLNSSYCLNNCLSSRDRQPNTIVFLLDPVTVTTGLLPAEIHFFLLIT